MIATSVGCGDDGGGPLVAKAGEVVRACTSKVYAKRPFGTNTLVDRYSIELDLGPEIRGFVVSAWDEGASTTLSSLHPPSGFPYDLVLSDDLERFHPGGLAAIYGWPVDVDRLMVPPSPAQHYMIEPGRWEVRGDTGGGRFCVSLAASSGPGTDLHLSVYVVGVEGLAAGAAASNADWTEVLGHVRQVFGAAGLRVRTDDVLYRDSGQVETVRFRMLRSWEDFKDLVATSETPSRAEGGPLRLNVFLVRGFGGELPAGLLGVSSGVPGVAGVHGTTDSGIVFGVEDYLGVADVGGVTGNEYLGEVMAHEIGHFLGLFHTTEVFGGSDPLDDTPACPGIDRLQSREAMLGACEDTANLMFPIAIPGAGSELTAGQVATVEINPLLRPAGT